MAMVRPARAPKRSGHAVAGAAVAGGSLLAIALLLVPRAVPPREEAAPLARIVVAPASSAAEPVATAPAPPAIDGVAAASADAFVGEWREPRGDRLTVARVAADRYDVTLTTAEAVERYDGILADGRVQIARGIDGEWIQAATGAAACLRLGATRTFCRS